MSSLRRRASARVFHTLTVKDYTWDPAAGQRAKEWYVDSAERFLKRFDPPLHFAGRTVLDVGTGDGLLCGLAARAGAERVVGIDVQSLDRARELISSDFADVADRIELIESAGDLHELGDRQFDLVISKEAMEHYGDPERFVPRMAELVAPGGELAVGFGPLWKAFDGAHMGFMTRFPWAHLLFSDEVVLRERRRFRPQEPATQWSEILGGLNQMTLERFERIIGSTGLQEVGVTHNAGDHPAVRAMRVLARVPPLREYFTNNVYGTWRRPTAAP